MYLDITERKEAEKEARRLESALSQAQKMEAIGTLAGGIAHDFNNILSAIMGFGQLAQMNCSDGRKVHEYMVDLLSASERARGLVQQILAFSRQTNPEKQPLDTGILVKETLKLLRASIPSSIEIKQDVQTGLGTVMANQTQIHQVVLNLCTNSAQAMGIRGGKLSVELTRAEITESDRSSFGNVPAGDYIRLTVADTGQGMDALTLSRIFEPYFTTKEVGQGTGMGLALVHGIVKDHGGDIKVYSEPGIGTTFHVIFPVITSEAIEETPSRDILPGGRETVLFVDDEKTLTEIGRELLEILGYRVETYTSPIDALKSFTANPERYDLLITDMTMPGINGDRLASEIKKLRSGLPVIICTGFSRIISEETIHETGIKAILMKPLSLSELARTARRVLDEAEDPG
jgi:nitrogen-specific signal transduction histidine kinase/ActR/RegA family two-component response regulator